MRQKFLVFSLLCLSTALVLTGCGRRRIITALTADEVIQQTEPTEPPSEPPAEPPTQSPTVETATPTEPSADPTESADQSTQTAEVSSATVPAPVSDSSAPGPDTGSAAPAEPTEPEPTQASGDLVVTLDPNRGTCDTPSLLVQAGQPYGALPAAYRSGYRFTGWYLTRNGGTAITEQTVVTQSGDHTLYAHWSERQAYTLNFDAQGGRLSSGEDSRTIYDGEYYGELPLPTRPGYDFLGWFTEDGAQVAETDVFSAGRDQTLFAQWNYDPFAFWTFTLQNITQQVYACQEVSVYVEFSDHETANYCSLLAATGTYNVAVNADSTSVTDEWVNEKNPDVLVKFVFDMGSAAGDYSAMAARFPGRRILIVPSAAVYGGPSEQLYYQLCFGKLLYPDWYGEVDSAVVGAELGVNGTIYGS